MTVQSFTTYDNNGYLLNTGQAGDIDAQVEYDDDAYGVIAEEVDDINKWHIVDIDNPVLTINKQNTTTINKVEVVADGIDKIILDNVPIGSTVSVIGNTNISGVADENIVDLVFEIPGSYDVQVNKFGFYTFGVMVNAT